MAQSFRKTDRKLKEAAAVGVFSSFALAIYGLLNRGNFAASPNIETFALAASPVLAVVTSVYFYKAQQSTNKIAQLGFAARIGLFPIISTLMLGVYWAALSQGVPLIHTELTGTDVSAQVVVTDRLAEHDGKGCRYRLNISSKEVKTEGHTCVSKELWTNARPGGWLNAELRVGTFGTYISTLRAE